MGAIKPNVRFLRQIIHMLEGENFLISTGGHLLSMCGARDCLEGSLIGKTPDSSSGDPGSRKLLNLSKPCQFQKNPVNPSCRKLHQGHALKADWRQKPQAERTRNRRKKKDDDDDDDDDDNGDDNDGN